jgi:hypothetical protein
MIDRREILSSVTSLHVASVAQLSMVVFGPPLVAETKVIDGLAGSTLV